MDENEPAKKTRLCDACKKEYEVKRYWQKFCSAKCRLDYYWVTHKVIEVPRNEDGISKQKEESL